MEARTTLPQLQAAAASQKAEEIHNRAHYLKGSSLMLGAKKVVQCCVTLDEMGRAGDFSSMRQILEETAAALNEVEAELGKRLGPEALPAAGSAA
jgi:HPt (histidine-containing phosphotransfer) domain-containing protein